MLYQYVGSRDIAERAGLAVRGAPVASPEDARRWLAGAEPNAAGEVTVTFVVDEFGTLLIADRHSEHVACAGNRPVRAAGELCFAPEDGTVAVTRVSNQSTGYCPEPETWSEVVAALRHAGLEPPTDFEPRCEFRRCLSCASLNLVKSGVFECGVCEAELPREYNCQPHSGPRNAACQYRVTKCDPRFRENGAFLRNEWTSFDQIGEAFEGVVLTPEAYQRVEDAYVAAALAFLRETGCLALHCVSVENHRNAPTARAEGASVPLSDLVPVIRALLRAEWWCRLEAPGAFLHFGYDYYMYVGVPSACEQSRALAHQHGLFVEPFTSPYHPEE